MAEETITHGHQPPGLPITSSLKLGRTEKNAVEIRPAETRNGEEA